MPGTIGNPINIFRNILRRAKNVILLSLSKVSAPCITHSVPSEVYFLQALSPHGKPHIALLCDEIS